MSLDEYMAAQKSKLAALPQLKAERKVDNSAGGIEFSRDQGGKEDEELGMIFKSYDGKVADPSLPLHRQLETRPPQNTPASSRCDPSPPLSAHQG